MKILLAFLLNYPDFPDSCGFHKLSRPVCIVGISLLLSFIGICFVAAAKKTDNFYKKHFSADYYDAQFPTS